MHSQNSLCQNHLLAAIPIAELVRISSRLERVSLRLGDVLYQPGTPVTDVYFPISAIVSLLYVMKGNDLAEVAVVGNEGLVGIPLFVGSEMTSSQAVVQNSGDAYRIKWHLLKDEMFRTGPLQRLFNLYTQTLLTQMVQTAVCNRHHSLNQRLCRWLLLSLDRLPTDELAMTEALIGEMIGGSRESVIEAIENLQATSLITYQHGHIRVLDREGLQEQVCECYGVVKKAYARLLPEAITYSIIRPRIGRPHHTAGASGAAYL